MAHGIRRVVLLVLAFVITLTITTTAYASNIYYYANWTADTLSGAGNGSATGTIITPQGTVNISYTGDVVSSTQINNIGTDYYTAWQSVYTNSTVSNSPTNVDVISLSQAQAYTDTLTFSTPITNPIVDIVSLGPTVSYIFSATPVLLSQGSASFGGCGTCLSITGNTLTGTEGDGVVEFVGTFSSISWTTSGGEYWNGFTIGVAGEATAAPEPATWGGMMIAAMLALPFLRRRKGWALNGRR